MRYICIKLCLISLLIIFLRAGEVSAQTTNLTASVGNYYFSVSGYNSPFASIVLSSHSVFMASVVANKDGYFSIKNVLMNEGFSNFCFEAVDARRVGESFTCLEIPPATGDVIKENIFLPPTLGVSGRKINPGSSITASGYSMPNADVILNISKDIILRAKADGTGFYSIEVKELPPGKYNLFATGRFEGKDSEVPTKKILVESLSMGDLLGQNLLKIITVVLIFLSIIILLLILLSKKIRRRLGEILKRRPVAKKKKGSSMHHEWLIGY